MSQAKSVRLFFTFYLMLAASMSGCSDPNAQSRFNPETGKHSANWLPAAHREAAASGIHSCSSCHGTDLKGGISGVSCTACHLGSATSVHPADWAPLYSTHGPYANTNSTAACANQYCHGTSLTGVAGSGPSCTSCHMGSPTSVHPTDWITILNTHGPYVKTNTTSACANQYCHGLLLTGVANSGPSCTSCHLGGPTSGHPPNWVPVYSTHGPYVNANGTGACSNQSCHGPALSGVVSSGPSCTVCHLGSPTSVHPLNWAPMYSKHAPYVTANGTNACSNQYCHGSSLTGVANSGPSCTSCHLGGVTGVHPAAWMGDACSNHGNYAYTNGTAGCANIYCHGANLGGVQDSGPSCTQCHSTIPNSNQCNYCHGRSPDGMPDGTVYPNIAGKHAAHVQIAGVTCTTCHKRTCDQHDNGVVDVVFDPSGPAVAAGNPVPAFDSTAKSCSNIACHIISAGTFSYYFPDGAGNPVLTTVHIYGNTGGITPSWYAAGTSCTACHNDPPSNGTDGSNIWHSGYHGGQGPTGPYNQCQLCHPDASSPNNGIGDTITNPLLHRNGTYNVQPLFNSPCFSCH
jgi:hypothetical protein